MMKLKNKLIITVLTVVILLSLTACKGDNYYQTEYLLLFDTVTDISGYADSKEEFDEFARFVYDGLKEYNDLFDIYNDYEGINNLKTINDNAGIRPVKVDKRIIELIRFAREQYDLTSGRINIAFGAVLSVWHRYRTQGLDDPDNARLPRDEELENGAKHTDIDKIIIDDEKSTVYLADKEMSLDVGAVAKGYAVEQVCRAAEKKGYENYLVNVGGNVRTLGTKPGGEKWNVGIEGAEADGTVAAVAEVEKKAVVTSGKNKRYYTVNGKRYHHIIDPDTLYPSQRHASVTVISDDSALADCLTTALFNMSYADGNALIEKLKNTEAMWISNDGESRYSAGFAGFLAG